MAVRVTMAILSAVVLLSFTVSHSLALHDSISDRYDFQLNLTFPQQPGAAPFKFFYTYDRDNQLLKMAVQVLSLGWVGIGFSSNQAMPDTDVAIGWVDDSGRGFLQDRYAFTRGLPRLDQRQDWNLINATEQDGYTIIEMERPLETCDTQDDFTLNVGDTIYLLYAYHSMDPESNESSIPQHQFRQSQIVSLFGSIVEPPEPSDATYLDILVDSVRIPSADTTYWCRTQRLPQTVIDETHYITSFEALLQQNTSDHVHHILVYKCDDLTNSSGANSSDVCDELHEEARRCQDNLLIGGWAVGAQKFVYPENVALPIGGERNDKYLLIEIHYDNPRMETDNIDSSGIRFTLTRTPRQLSAGIIGVGSRVNTNLFVPPNTNRFNIYGYCPSGCTDQFIPANGITVFANFLHTHTVGEGVILRHVRNGVEMPPIDQNLFYDFNFQLTNHVTPRTVLPGDDFIVECIYNTSGRRAATFGGESTTEEMCLSFIYYYPEVPVTYCVSSPNTDQYMDWFQKYAPDRLDVLNNNGMLGEAQAFLESFNWTDDSLRDLETVNVQNIHTLICGRNGYWDEPPQISHPYQPPDVCTSEGAGAAQVMYSTVAIIFLAMMTVLLQLL